MDEAALRRSALLARSIGQNRGRDLEPAHPLQQNLEQPNPHGHLQRAAEHEAFVVPSIGTGGQGHASLWIVLELLDSHKWQHDPKWDRSKLPSIEPRTLPMDCHRRPGKHLWW